MKCCHAAREFDGALQLADGIRVSHLAQVRCMPYRMPSLLQRVTRVGPPQPVRPQWWA